MKTTPVTPRRHSVEDRQIETLTVLSAKAGILRRLIANMDPRDAFQALVVVTAQIHEAEDLLVNGNQLPRGILDDRLRAVRDEAIALMDEAGGEHRSFIRRRYGQGGG